MEVNFGTRDSGMSKISRQQWQLGEKIRPFAMPRQETIYGKCVTKIVNARSALALSLTSSPLFWFSLVVGSFRNRFVASNIW
jgi:hypothetical protein